MYFLRDTSFTVTTVKGALRVEMVSLRLFHFNYEPDLHVALPFRRNAATETEPWLYSHENSRRVALSLF